mmetsp:Transcript_95802/g.175522  ORF Transcript_95802/g.175522 Transcript_95802/m.175522 type:complete len:102 (+) Transcript_95802:63-368(+)
MANSLWGTLLAKVLQCMLQILVCGALTQSLRVGVTMKLIGQTVEAPAIRRVEAEAVKEEAVEVAEAGEAGAAVINKGMERTALAPSQGRPTALPGKQRSRL